MVNLFYLCRRFRFMKKFLIPLICLLAAACSSVPVSKSSEYLAKGEMYYKTGRVQKALKYFNKAVAEDPYNAEAYLSRGTLLYSAGEYDKAIDDFGVVLDSDKNVPELYSALGAAYAAKGEYAKAREALLKSLELYPANVAALNSLGGIYYSTGNYNAAIKEYDKALALRPVYQIYYMRGVCYEKLGRTQEAEADFKAAEALEN